MKCCICNQEATLIVNHSIPVCAEHRPQITKDGDIVGHLPQSKRICCGCKREIAFYEFFCVIEDYRNPGKLLDKCERCCKGQKSQCNNCSKWIDSQHVMFLAVGIDGKHIEGKYECYTCRNGREGYYIEHYKEIQESYNHFWTLLNECIKDRSKFMMLLPRNTGMGFSFVLEDPKPDVTVICKV